MERDFTVASYKNLLNAFVYSGYYCSTYLDFVTSRSPQNRTVILRHDVDDRPENSVQFAEIEASLGLLGTYYFRNVKESFDAEKIKKIADFGHEIGYHYEDLSLSKGDCVAAIQSFERNLTLFREFYPVKTICMHGSPMSRFDNRDIWKIYDYRKYGIIAEPYFDTDFNDVFYISDTGRGWNNVCASVRDKVRSPFDIAIIDSIDFVHLITSGSFPDKVMLNVHPQRWNDNYSEWLTELIWQNIKNVCKTIMLGLR